MGRKILVLLLCLVSARYLTHCTSKGSEDATEETPEAQEDGNTDPIDNPDGAIADNPEEDTTAGVVSEVPPAETKPASETPPDVNPSDNAGTAPLAGTNEPPPPSPMTIESSSVTPPMATTPEPRVVRPAAPYQKVAATPFNSGKKLMNAVYVARKGDTWNKVATKVLNAKSAAKDLKKWNSSLSFRELKVGDKVYYNSPNRPDDSAKLLTFFEDKGDIPQTYVAKEGDSLKKVAKELLGSEENWKELWATNNFESKGSLGAGTEIKYWTSVPEEPPPKVVAQNEPHQNMEPPVRETPPPAQPPQPPVVNNVPPPVSNVAPPPEEPQPPVAQNNEPAPPPVNNVPQPPVQQPPVVAGNEPAPEDQPAESNEAQEASGDDSQIMYLAGGVGLVLVIVIVMVMRRRKAAQEMDDQAFDEKTHVG